MTIQEVIEHASKIRMYTEKLKIHKAAIETKEAQAAMDELVNKHIRLAITTQDGGDRVYECKVTDVIENRIYFVPDNHPDEQWHVAFGAISEITEI